MSVRVPVLLLASLLSLSALAQQDEEDDLAPLAPIPKAKPKPKPRPKPKAKPTTTRPSDDELAPLVPVATTGELVVKVAGGISRAVLSIDGKEVGQLPLAPQTVCAGEHIVTVKRAGYAQFVKKVLVTGGTQTEVEAKLAPVSAVISVKSDVDDAQVLINGRLIGTAPVVDYEFPPGPVTISVIKEGFKEDTQKLTLVAGKDYPIEVKFKPAEVAAAATDRPIETTLTPLVQAPPPIEVKKGPVETPLYQRWYFWAGVGAVVVAAAAGTAVAVGTANAQPRKLSEQEICGGPCDGCIGFTCGMTAHNPLLSSNPTRFEF
jgi:hypothetical protein